jgi:hypothetical protein
MGAWAHGQGRMGLGRALQPLQYSVRSPRQLNSATYVQGGSWGAPGCELAARGSSAWVAAASVAFQHAAFSSSLRGTTAPSISSHLQHELILVSVRVLLDVALRGAASEHPVSEPCLHRMGRAGEGSLLPAGPEGQLPDTLTLTWQPMKTQWTRRRAA